MGLESCLGLVIGLLFFLIFVGRSEWLVRRLGVEGLIIGDGFMVGSFFLTRWMGGLEGFRLK